MPEWNFIKLMVKNSFNNPLASNLKAIWIFPSKKRMTKLTYIIV